MNPVKYVPQSYFGCFRIVGAEYALVQFGELDNAQSEAGWFKFLETADYLSAAVQMVDDPIRVHQISHGFTIPAFAWNRQSELRSSSA